MSNLTTRILKTVGCHFVTLSCVQRVPSTPGEKTHIISGFLVEVADVWFYVTAGHILRDIRKSLAAGCTFDIWRLDDQTAGNKFNGIGIPYSFNIESWLVLEDAEIGLDYAAVPLSGLYRQGLIAGGATPIGREAWSDHVTEHDFWALVGVPSETVGYDNETIITARVVIAPVTPADEPPMAQMKAPNQFYAKLADGAEQYFRDVDGMSGGPIFAIKKVESIWKYWVIGVQSAWYPMSKILAICPFSSFGQVLEEVVGKTLQIQDRSSADTILN
jgi:hypothetical protein